MRIGREETAGPGREMAAVMSNVVEDFSPFFNAEERTEVLNYFPEALPFQSSTSSHSVLRH